MILNLDKIPQDRISVLDSEYNKYTYGDIVSFKDKLLDLNKDRALTFLLVENDAAGVVWIMGCLSSNFVPLILNANTEANLLNHLSTLYRPKFFCVPDGILNKFDHYLVILEYGGYTLLETENDIYELNPELSHLLPTSGSTGSPKLVRHKYENIEAAALNISICFELTSDDRPLLVLPLYYTMGLSVVFSHLYVGATILITKLNMTDRGFWKFIKDEKASSFTGVPYSYEILNLMRFFKMNLPNLKLLTQGGGKMPTDLNLKFAEHCSSHGMKWIATYGQSEGTARMAYLPAEYAVSKCGSIGKAIPNGELYLINEKGCIIEEPNVKGEMCYRGKNVTLGYATQIKDLLLGDERCGELRTGDLAYRDEDGFYYIVGRISRFLKLFGMRIGLDECEQIIKSSYPIECACVGNDEKMVVYLTDESYVSKVRNLLVKNTHLVGSVFEMRIVNEIPKNEAGKILYSKIMI